MFGHSRVNESYDELRVEKRQSQSQLSDEIPRGIATFTAKNSIPQLISFASESEFSGTGKASKKKKPRQQLK